ncbi:MAG: peptide ABC transporter substrate-binding protein, partial [Thermomicrobiaceae bacterium]|nr:peptide ABC transporter substrate-binding protein [Thermomicrobiaceae bacterium]
MTDSRLRDLYSDVLAGKLTRRDVLRKGAALGLSASALAGLLAACGGGGESSPTSTSGGTSSGGATGGTPSAGGSPAAGGQATGGTRGEGGLLKLLWWQAPTILNGHFAQGTKDFDASMVVLEPLADIDKSGNLVPKLAAEIPSLENGGVAKDGKSVTWKLKQGVKWSDGEPFTSKDVKFTYDLVINEQTNATTVGNYKVIESVETPDDYTVVIKFKQPTPGWMNVFVGPYGQILPEHKLKDAIGPNAIQNPFNLKPIGTGPFKVDDFRPGDVVQYSANENYREPNKPFFAKVELKGGGDATSAARAAVQTGDVDYAWNLQVEEQVLKNLEQGGVGVFEVIPGGNLERILVNMTDPNKEVDGERSSLKAPHPFQSDLEVRKAYALLCDRDAIAALYGRAGKPASNVLIAPDRFVSKNTSWKFDVEAAKKQLDSAGWTMQG